MFKKERIAQLEKTLSEYVEDGVFPGCNLAIVSDDDIYKTSVGYKQLVPEKIPNDLNTIYDLASLSKVTTTVTCLLKLMEEGKLSLNDKVSSYLDIAEKDLTINHCITHTTGFHRDIPGYKQMTKEELIKTIMNAKCEVPFGTRVAYSDINFLYLGFIVDKLTGSLDKYAHQVLFDPLEMKDTGYNPSKDKYERCASYEDEPARGGIIKGAVHDGKCYKLGGVTGHAGVFSTIEDLTHYVKMLLDNGTYEGKEILTPQSMELYTKLRTSGLNERRSIGWVLADPNYALGDYYSPKTIYHTGFTGTSILVDFENRLAIIILCNRVHPSRNNLKILELRNHLHDLAYLCK